MKTLPWLLRANTWYLTQFDIFCSCLEGGHTTPKKLPSFLYYTLTSLFYLTLPCYTALMTLTHQAHLQWQVRTTRTTTSDKCTRVGLPWLKPLFGVIWIGALEQLGLFECDWFSDVSLWKLGLNVYCHHTYTPQPQVKLPFLYFNNFPQPH